MIRFSIKPLTVVLVALVALAAMLNASYAADIRPALVHTFGNEGGFQKDPHDAGNYVNGRLIGTKFGIAARSYPNEDIPNLTIDRAGALYERDFWGASRCGQWRNQIIANLYFDLAVNMGQGTAARIIQRAVNYAGWPRPPIPVDGKIGSGTVKRLNDVDQTNLFCHLVGLSHARYVQIVDKNPKNMRYMSEWVGHRLRKNVQRSVHEYEAMRAKR